MLGSSVRCSQCDKKLSNANLPQCPYCNAPLREEVATEPAPGTPHVIYDRPDQVEKIAAALLPGEQLEAVFDMKGGGTGFLGITDKRLIVYDKSFLRKMKAVVSIPYSRVHTVAAKDESGLFTGRGFYASSELIVTTSAGEFEFEFRGADKAHKAHELIIRRMVG